MKHTSFLHFRAVLVAAICLFLTAVPSVRAADRDKVAAFLSVTGFDVALDSLRLSASMAPTMLGVEKGDFGSQWTRMADKVFDPQIMRAMAADFLAELLSEENLSHAAAFYASDLGQRLVEAENASHMMEDDGKIESGKALVAEMVANGSKRVEILRQMSRAIDSSGQGVRAFQEIQLRFLLAASGAGVVDLKMDEGELRAFLQSREGDLRRAMLQNGLAGSAYTYQGFSDADLEAYVAALETPQMQSVYELMNAVQFEILANRFEALAVEMAGLKPEQDI